ncbi:Reverse transcriptase (RNA-dependent DNA polymerase) [Fragilaria crotonensis]|nr:Reverse transcriptase (RNA-dependent DNA polymerase) [Fragilaria crotonensis]
MTRFGGMSYQETAVPHTGSKFEGSCKELKGYIYDCSNVLDSDTFDTTTERIAEYVGRSFKYGGDIRCAVLTLRTPVLQQPTKPPEDATKTQIRIWEKRCDAYLERKTITIENIEALYTLIWGQCAYDLRQKLDALDEFEDISNKRDGVALLKAIKSTAYSYQSHKYLPLALHELMHRFYNTRQDGHMTNEQYLTQFQKIIAVIEHNGGFVDLAPGLDKIIAIELGLDPENLDEQQKQDVAKESHSRYLATAFISGADPVRYGRLVENLENDFLMGRDNYPKTVRAAYNIMTFWK